MLLPSRQVLAGMALGAICAFGLSAIGPGLIIEAFGDEQPVGIDPNDLVRFEGRDYTMDYEDWVSTDPLSQSRVKKIEMGRVSYVDITTTATGTYSTDALFSNHIQYPGITVTEATPPIHANRLSFWNGRTWMSFGSIDGHSIFSLRSDGVRIHQHGSDTCIGVKGIYVC